MINPAIRDVTPPPVVPKQGMPITIITGFLGSGKTTLLNHILTNNQGLKVAVLVNEFGDIDIDSQLLISTDQDMVQLSNGCICCTINDGLVDAVYNVLEKAEAIDYMVIETTGIADPLPIMLTFLSTELRDLTHVDSVITIVDAAEFTQDHFDSEAALKQVVYADIILLNKIDLVDDKTVDLLEKHIRQLKDGARIIQCQQSAVPLPLILDVGFNDASLYTSQVNTPVDREHGHHDHHHAHDHHDHADHSHHSDHLDNDGFVSISYQSDRPFVLQKFQSFLEQLPVEVFRGKGILYFQESPHKHIFQLSGKRCTLTIADWTTSRPPTTSATTTAMNQLVFIGRHLHPDQLRQHLANCHLSS